VQRFLYFRVRWLQLNSVVKAVASALELVFTALLSVPILGKMTLHIDITMSYRIWYENNVCTQKKNKKNVLNRYSTELGDECCNYHHLSGCSCLREASNQQ
jgi:hypothetical protein